MAKDFDTMEDSNRSANADIHSVSDPARRVWLHGGLAALAGSALAPLFAGCATTAESEAYLKQKAARDKGLETLVGSRLVKPTTERHVRAIGNQEYTQENYNDHRGAANKLPGAN